jgi:DNA modification methylase
MDSGERFHKQQSPISLLLRIILSSTKAGDTVLDPFSGTGTTLIVAKQLKRKSIGIEIDRDNVECIKDRLENLKKEDYIDEYLHYYRFTENLQCLWGLTESIREQENDYVENDSLFRV